MYICIYIYIYQSDHQSDHQRENTFIVMIKRSSDVWFQKDSKMNTKNHFLKKTEQLLSKN